MLSAPPACMPPLQRSVYPGSSSAGRRRCTPTAITINPPRERFRFLFYKKLCEMANPAYPPPAAGNSGTTTIISSVYTGPTASVVTIVSVIGGGPGTTLIASSPVASDRGGESPAPTAITSTGGNPPTPTTTASSRSSGHSGVAGPSSSNDPDPSSSPSFNSGTVAGAAVGAFAGGLLIGLAILLLAIRRRRRKQKHSLPKQPSIETHNEVVRPKDRGPTDRPHQTESSLLDATSDGELVEVYRNIYKLLQQHMDNFYHTQPVEVDYDTIMRAAERLELVSDDVLALESLTSLVLDPRTRAAALHHIIAQVLVKSIDFNSPGTLSMLPPHLVGLARSFPAAERGGGNSDGKYPVYFYLLICGHVLTLLRTTAFGKSLHQWRTLTVYLLQPHRSHRLPLVPSEEAVKAQTESVISALVDFLGPFVAVDELSRAKQRSHLQAIAFECAKFGYLLLSQPREWQFLYQNPSQAKGGDKRRGGPQLVEAPVVAKI
ncbi:hypothetical protein PG996_013827 [Apiospora saccharicola]|uniref:Uncharacterized protein n=1 Tax=Apiospora saccharicola TaxID=335842 RepID=A0ABR1TGK0_9PEZI